MENLKDILSSWIVWGTALTAIMMTLFFILTKWSGKKVTAVHLVMEKINNKNGKDHYLITLKLYDDHITNLGERQWKTTEKNDSYSMIQKIASFLDFVYDFKTNFDLENMGSYPSGEKEMIIIFTGLPQGRNIMLDEIQFI